jgi:phenylacetate-coenzyme A ligase PaaK-like adenylate-forming protein
MPLVRFELGDSVRLLPSTDCRCGRTAPLVQHFGRDLNRFEFAGRKYFVRDLEELLLSAPAAAVGDLWLVDVRADVVHFRVEAERPDPALYRRLEQQVGNDLGLPLVIDAAPPGTLLDRSRFTYVRPVGKPRVVGTGRPPDADPLTLDVLMEMS